MLHAMFGEQNAGQEQKKKKDEQNPFWMSHVPRCFGMCQTKETKVCGSPHIILCRQIQVLDQAGANAPNKKKKKKKRQNFQINKKYKIQR